MEKVLNIDIRQEKLNHKGCAFLFVQELAVLQMAH